MPGMNGVLKKKAKHLNVTNHLRLIPDDEGDVEIGVSYLWDSPVYWQLPTSFLGDKVNICFHSSKVKCKILPPTFHILGT